MRLKLEKQKEPAGFGPSVYSGADGERQGLGEDRPDWATEEEKLPPLLSMGVTGRASHDSRAWSYTGFVLKVV